MVQRFVTRALYFGALGLIWFSAVSCPGRVRASAAVVPIRLLVLYDQTASRDQSRIAPLTTADVRRLADLVAARGGELAFGVIDESSDQPLTRLYAGPPPQAPPPPTRTGNPFEDRKRVRAHAAESAAFRSALTSWRARVELDLGRFLTRVAAGLQREVLAPATDIRGAVDRARLFFGEPRTHSGGSTDAFLLITDGVETRRPGVAPPLHGTVRVAVVNGAGSVGALSSLEPVSFEGIDAAIRWIEAGP